MRTIIKNWFRILIISVTCGTLDFLLQGATSSLHTNNLQAVPPSIFVKTGTVYPVLILYYWVVYIVLACIFVLIQQELPGSQKKKGTLFGLCFGMMYLIGMYEGILILKDTFVNSTWVGLCDGLPILLMGVLTGVFVGTPGNKNHRIQKPLAVFIISLLFILGRYLSYSMLHIQSAYQDIPLGTFLWTLCQGLWVSVMYLTLRPGVKGKFSISRALFFGAFIFGVNWLLYHFFIPIMFETSVSDILIRVGVDVLSVTAGAFIYEKIITKLQVVE